MEFTARQIADFLQGTLEGDPQATVSTFAKIEEGKPGAISFLSNPKYANYLYETQSSVVLINKDFKPEQPVRATIIRVDNAYECVARLLKMYEMSKPARKGIHPMAFVSETAKLGEDCYVGPFAYIGENVTVGKGTQIYPHAVLEQNAKVGENCLIYPNVSVYHDCVVGNRVTLHSGCVIGADGFGFAPTEDGYEKIPQIGIVVIEDDVEIGANACVDRSTMGATIVHKDVKVDNLVQLAHNTEVGSHTVLSAQTGVAGSTKIGEWCMFGGQVGITGHAKIADRVRAGAQTGIAGSIRKEGVALWGTPAIDYTQAQRSSVIFKKLPDLYKELNTMKKELEELKQQLQEK
ncbi:UDP-3-O-(3-hydroxymyristoyl)glucosamine N-acyltransferase [Pseudoprevotella muciniphila]|uniref:UDP-3-O-acylglucosamine N-acyltransferase n=1 Tax=Pseudoprevotella muciniphila TaxID=2133944 RepID=A0A5P8E901_9BACT|nr:UDP-3-O-(3-hydroxymyristoyl)glucosamine N-acyltransferase [Pseudoprevotella muciniphila]QFQ13515.1 UDP-3-O-(3-hydroxymyristoyl)glucosamine N-acyltransferase [Pseudoprevotella muciniphila]